jgi:hypothetical protein
MSKEKRDKLKIEYVSPHKLRPRSNTKLHSKQQIQKIAKSIRRFGFVNPALISDDKEIIAGVGRVEAAKQLGLDLIPTVRLSSLTPAEQLAYNLADNRLAEFGHLDRKLVAVQLEDLTSLGFDDIEITGFSLGDIDIHLETAAKKKSRKVAPEGEQPASRRSPASRRGDLWSFGPHRILIGDAEAAADCHRIIDRRQADMVLTEPVSDFPARRYRHPDFASADWKKSDEKFGALLSTFLRLAEKASSLGASVSVFVDSRPEGAMR